MYSWISAVSGNWNSAANWSGNAGSFPTISSDIVNINVTSTAAYTVTLNTNDGNASLMIGGDPNVIFAFGGAETLTTNGAVTLSTGEIQILADGGLLNTGTAVAATTSAATIIDIGSPDAGTGGTLTVRSGLSLGGTLEGTEGLGTVNGTGGISGSGTILANGGTLAISDAISSGPTLQVANNASGSTLELLNTATAAAAIALSASTETLEVGSGGALTISAAELVNGGTIQMAGSSATLTDSAGLTINSSGVLTGFGVVNPTIGTGDGTGTIVASGGTLDLVANLASNVGDHLQVAGGATLRLDGSGQGTGNTFSFLSASSGNIKYTANSGSFTATLSGMNVGTSSSAPTNFIDFTGQSGVTITSGFVQSGAGTATVQLSNGSSLTLSGLSGSDSGTWYVDSQSDGGSGTEFFLSNQVCYASGTRILTATGERMVDSLQPGDIVLTLVGGMFDAQPVKWIGRRRLDLTAHPRPETVAPIRIQRGAFADAMPHSDLLVSPDHAILVDGVLICARQLINGTTIRQETEWTSVEYFHVELDAHAILLAEGLPAESYLDTGNRGFFANAGAPLVLHPDLTNESDNPTREAASCAPFVSDEVRVRPVWQRLAARAAALGQPTWEHETTTDPAVRIVAKGRTLQPLFGEDGLYVFALPKGTTEVRLVSRASAPTDAQPWLEDRRNLGIYVGRVMLRGANEVLDVPVDHPGLSRGWWAVERDGTALRRWTNGDAVLSLPQFEHPAMLEIHATSSGMAYSVAPIPARQAA
jgi:hypothetical protein